MEQMEDHNFDFCDCALEDHRLTINIKDEIVECGFVEVDSDNVNQLCMACLCATRTTQKLSDDTLKQFYMDILREMQMLTNYGNEVSPRICWECVSLLKKFVCFKKQVKESYAILQPMLQIFDEGLDNFLQTSLYRPGRLKICVVDSVDIQPGCDDDDDASEQFAPVVVKVESVSSNDAVCTDDHKNDFDDGGIDHQLPPAVINVSLRDDAVYPSDDDDIDDDDEEGVTEMRFAPDIAVLPSDDDDGRREQEFHPVINLGLRDGTEYPDDGDIGDGNNDDGRTEQLLAPVVISLGLRDGTESPGDDDNGDDDYGRAVQQLAPAVISLGLRDGTESPGDDDNGDDDYGRAVQQLAPAVISLGLRDGTESPGDDDNGDDDYGRAVQQLAPAVISLGLRDGTESPGDDGNGDDDDGRAVQQLAPAVISLGLRDGTEYPDDDNDIDDGNIDNDDDGGTEQQLSQVVINIGMRDDAVCRNDDSSEQPSTVVVELGTGETGVRALEENISQLLEHSIITVYEEDFEAFALKHSHVTDLDDLMFDELSSNPNFQDKYNSEQTEHTEQIEQTGVRTRSKSYAIKHIVAKSETTALVGRSKTKQCLNKRKYKTRGNTKLHESSEKPLKCHLCSKAYSVMNNLRFHISLAHGVRRFRCKKCFKKFTRKQSLNRHMKLHEFQTKHPNNNYDSEQIEDTDNTCYPDNNYGSEQIEDTDNTCYPDNNYDSEQIEDADNTCNPETIHEQIEDTDNTCYPDNNYDSEQIEDTDNTCYPETIHEQIGHTDEHRGTENNEIKRQVENPDETKFLLEGSQHNYDISVVIEHIEHTDDTQYPELLLHYETEHTDERTGIENNGIKCQVEISDAKTFLLKGSEQNYDTEQIGHTDNTQNPDQYDDTVQIEHTDNTQFTEHNYDTEQIEHTDNTQYPDQYYDTDQIEHTDNTQYTEHNYDTEQIVHTDEYTETENKEIKRQVENTDDKTFLIGGSKVEEFMQNPFNRFVHGSERVKYKRYKWPATGKKPFNCNICSKAYCVESNLYKHIAFKHHMHTKRLQCEKCSKTFMFKSHLYRHMNAHKFQIQYPKLYYDPARNEHNDKRTGTENIEIKREIENPAKTTFLFDGLKTEEYKQDQFKYKRYKRPTTAKKLFRCCICSKQYHIESYFIKHINTHTRSELQCKINYTQAKSLTEQYHVSFFDNSADQLDNSDGHSTSTRKENNELETKSSSNQDIRNPLSFVCDYCKAEFACKSKLERHIAIHYVIDVPRDERSETTENIIKGIVHKYQCHKCLRTFSANPFLIRHLKQIHNEKPYRCEKCSKLFLFERRLLRHMKTHEFNTQYPKHSQGTEQDEHGDNTEYPEQIKHTDNTQYLIYYDTEQVVNDDNTQNSEQYYKPEQIEHTVNIPYPDHDYVIKHFENTDKLKERDNHTKTYYNKTKTNPEVGSSRSLNKSFVCDYCKKEFPRKTELERHITTFNHNAAPNPCVDCAIVLCLDEQCTECQRNNMMKNTQANSTDMTSMLEEPSRRLNSNGQTKHERYHKCQTCLRTFVTEYWLMKHVCSGKRFECDMCLKRFLSNFTLRRHLETHAPKKPFWCHFCGNTFTQKSRLYSHQWQFHKDYLEYHCHQCPRAYNLEIDLDRHVRRTHIFDMKTISGRS